MSNDILTTVPNPPDALSGDGRRLWYETGLSLVKNGSLTPDSLETLKDLCYWEDQRLSSLQNLRKLQRDSAPGSGRESRGIILKNLKAIRKEITNIRKQLGVPVEHAGEISDAPPIPEEAYQSLPRPLLACCSLLTDPVAKDIFLLSVLPVAAATMHPVLIELADGFCTASVRSYVVDESGKADRIVQRIKAFCDASRKKNVEGIPHFIPLNSKSWSGTDRTNVPGLVYHVDEKEHSGWQDRLKGNSNAFKNWLEDPFLTYPVAGQEINAADSSVFTGDMESLIGFSEASGTETGITTNCLVYFGENDSGWQSHRPDASSRAFNKQFNSFLDLLAGIGKVVRARSEPLIVELTGNQWEMIDDTFAEKLEIIEELALPEGLKNANQKAAVHSLKLSLICSVLRRFDENPAELEEVEWITADDDDVIAALWIADTCLKHLTRAYEQIPLQAGKDARGERYTTYFNLLPPRFATPEAVELAGRMDIAARTAKRYLSTFVSEGKLVRVRRGRYRKVE